MLGEHDLVDIVIVAEVESQGRVVGIEARGSEPSDRDVPHRDGRSRSLSNRPPDPR